MTTRLPVSFAVRRTSCVGLCVLLAMAQPVHAQATPPTLEALVVAWGGPTLVPQCRKDAHMWDPALVVGEVCVWRQTRETWAPYELGGHRAFGKPLAELTWYRSVKDSAAALALRDSVGNGFRNIALLRANDCPGSARLWQTAGFYVHFVLGGRQPDGRLNVSFIATSFPSPEITQLICPGVPLVAPGVRPPQARLGSARGLDGGRAANARA